MPDPEIRYPDSLTLAQVDTIAELTIRSEMERGYSSSEYDYVSLYLFGRPLNREFKKKLRDLNIRIRYPKKHIIDGMNISIEFIRIDNDGSFLIYGSSSDIHQSVGFLYRLDPKFDRMIGFEELGRLTK